MKPTIVIVGRPNVGKSTLFNRLTRSQDALVADLPGLTRDRHYGHGRVGDKPYLIVDTGGFEPVATDGIMHEMARQTMQAITEADAIIFLVDVRSGLTPQDSLIADQLRKRSDCPVYLVANKAEGMAQAIAAAEFYALGLGTPRVISSAHGEGVAELMELVLNPFPSASEEMVPSHPRVAIIGRPNVGKSTLVNQLIGEERVIAFDEPGTTRDSIYIDFIEGDRHYTLIDTAGVRRRGKVFEAVEKFSVIKTLKAIDDANVVVLVLDARQEISEQDAHLAGFVLEAGRGLVVAINKWDGLDSAKREWIKLELPRKLKFLDFARFHYISALKGQGIGGLLRSVDETYQAAFIRLPTPKLTRLLIEAVSQHQPPKNGPFRPKLRYAHQGGQNPPIVVVHGSAVNHVSESYRRYLENTFRKAFKVVGTPLRVEFHQGHNPFADRRPAPLTEREEKRAHRRRMHLRKTYGKKPKKG